MSGTPVQVGSSLYFSQQDATNGNELWKSDLDGSNAMLVKDIYAGAASSNPGNLFAFNGKLYFSANGGAAFGIELWTSDGTAAGTKMIDIETGHASANPQHFITIGNHFIFTADYADGGISPGVYTSDGTQAGTGKLLGFTYAEDETVPVLQQNGLAQFTSTAVGPAHITVTYQTDGTHAGTFIVPAGGVLPVEGTFNADTILLTSAGGVTTVTVNGVSHDYNNSDFSQIIVEGQGGIDTITADASVTTPMRILAKGNITGGSGNDTIVGQIGIDSFDGGAGTNTADFSTARSAISVNNANTLVSDEWGTTQLSNVQTLLTGSGNDQLNVLSNGTGGIQYIDTGAGNDVIVFLRQAAGATVHGGAGNDDILIRNYSQSASYFGDDGDDIFRVYRSSSTVRDFHGGTGNDTIDYSNFQWPYGTTRISLDDVANDGSSGEFGNTYSDNVHSDIEVVIGTDGADTIVGSVSGTTVFAGKGNDRVQLVSSAGTSNKVYGQAGDDTVVGGNGADRVYGGDGNDWMSGGGGNDILYGEAGNDRLFGGDGKDHLDGGDGNNVLRGEAGVDQIIASKTRDDYRSNAGDLITLLNT